MAGIMNTCTFQENDKSFIHGSTKWRGSATKRCITSTAGACMHHTARRRIHAYTAAISLTPYHAPLTPPPILSSVHVYVIVLGGVNGRMFGRQDTGAPLRPSRQLAKR